LTTVLSELISFINILKINILYNLINMAKSHPSVIAIGKNKGHPITKFKVAGKKASAGRPRDTKGRLGKRVSLIRQVIG